jgi:hypothetical protein
MNMKLFCEKCNTLMRYYTEYESKTLKPATIEMHQCQNEKCKEYATIFHYQISKGNRAIYMGEGTRPGMY